MTKCFNTVEEAIEYLHQEVRVGRQREIREGVERIIHQAMYASVKVGADSYTDLSTDFDVNCLLRYLDSQGVVIRTRIGSDIQGTALFAFEPLVDDGSWKG